VNDPYALPSFLVVTAVVVLGCAATILLLSLMVVAFSTVTRRRRWLLPAGLACAAGAAAIGGYVWGALHLTMDETQATELCRSAVPAEQAGHVAGYETTFIPLQFGCRLPDGQVVPTAVPDDVNGFVFGAAALAFAGAVTARSMRWSAMKDAESQVSAG
jgi:hypothetical protein